MKEKLLFGILCETKKFNGKLSQTPSSIFTDETQNVKLESAKKRKEKNSTRI